MELENFTPAPAILWRTILDEDRMAAAIVARLTYGIVDGRLLVDPSNAWGIDKAEYESPIGMLPPEDCFRRGGVDLLVFGSARAPRGRPTRKVELRVVLGEFVGGVDVHGERVWSRKGFGLVPSEAQPFVEMPLDLAHAYGGTQTWDQLPVPYVSNPICKGYYTEERHAQGQPLPNIEDPRRPVTRWDDNPDPVGVGLCPREFGPRVLRNVTFNEQGVTTRIDAKMFNDAFPDLVAPTPAPGARCQVFGVREDGPLEFLLPTPPLSVRVSLGDKQVERTLYSLWYVKIDPSQK